jgi:hypothetical protein
LNKKRFKDFYEAWWWLNTSEIFWHKDFETFLKDGSSLDRDEEGNLEYNKFKESLCVEVQKVNPKTCKIDDTAELNTKIEIWLECGEPYEKNGKFHSWYHNWQYDCGGDTFEEAIINLANIVYEHNN